MTVTARLRNCFAAVFPQVAVDRLEQASTATLADWDSLATVRLVAVVEEEFEILLDVEELEELDSFDRLQLLIERKLAAA